jgi:DNA end-binding protein Ku
MWTGTVSWNMLVIPVKLYKAVGDDSGPELHQFRKSDGSPIGFRRYAKADGAEVAYDDVRKGYELGNGQVVLLEDTDFELAYGAKFKQAGITAFIPAGSLPRIANDTSYYVAPDKNGERAYELLAAVMTRQSVAAIVSFAVREREAMGMLYANENGYLVLERLAWAADVRDPGFAAPQTGVLEQEIAQAEALVSLMTGEFNWNAAVNTSAQALMDVIQAKTETGQVTGTPAAAVPGTATAPGDIMAALTASVAAITAQHAPKAARKPRARRTATVKGAA